MKESIENTLLVGAWGGFLTGVPLLVFMWDSFTAKIPMLVGVGLCAAYIAVHLAKREIVNR